MRSLFISPLIFARAKDHKRLSCEFSFSLRFSITSQSQNFQTATKNNTIFFIFVHDSSTTQLMLTAQKFTTIWNSFKSFTSIYKEVNLLSLRNFPISCMCWWYFYVRPLRSGSACLLLLCNTFDLSRSVMFILKTF